MDREKAATIRDVARLAGLSAATVSRHLSGRLALPDDTAKRIRDAVTALGYSPNAMARRLSRGKSELIGFATTDIRYPFFAEIASAAEAELLGYDLVIFSTRNNVAKELGVLSKIRNQQVDGAILLTNHVDDGSLSSAINETGRVVLLDEDVPDAIAPRVFAENRIGSRLATEHLIDFGHKKIAFVGGPAGLLSSVERYGGFADAMAGAGLPQRPEFVKFGTYAWSFGGEALSELWAFEDRPTALVLATDQLAIGIVRAAAAMNIALPDDLSIVGFDDIEMASLLSPPLTTVRQSATDFGRRGVRALVQLLDGESARSATERVPVELVMRGSVMRLAT
jgi:LacI family transcriptional regulator